MCKYIHINCWIMRTNIEINDKLVEEAFSLTNVRTKKDLLELSGKIQFAEGYDYKSLRGNSKCC